MLLGAVVGQDHAVTLLGRAARLGRTAHAYLFDGPEGVGKRTTAIGLALALLCRLRPAEGCGTCDDCRRVLGGLHPDVRTFAPRKADYVIDQVRDEIIPLGSERPHEAAARVLILDDAHRLNVESANALLKTLEEPWPGVCFVLVTPAPDRLLPTIRSRTQRVRFVPLPAERIIALLEARGIPRARAEVAAALADGSVGRALAACEHAGDADQGPWQDVESVRAAAARGEVGAVFDAAGAFKGKERRDDLNQLVTLLGRLYRDALAEAAGAPELVLLRERAADVSAIAERGARHDVLWGLRRAICSVLETDAALAGNANAVTALERLLLRLAPVERAVAARGKASEPGASR